MKEIDDLDQLLAYLQNSKTIENGENELSEYNIDGKYVKVYLMSVVIVKFPTFFDNMKETTMILAKDVYEKQNLKESLIKFEEEFKEWKQQDIKHISQELDEMKERTRASSSETEDLNCIKCYQTQENIIDIAKDYFNKLKKL